MRKQLLSLGMVLAMFGFGHAQTFTYLNFEGAEPVHGEFGSSDFSIVDNPHATGVNTSAKVGMTQKHIDAGPAWWGGSYFPCGGTINFAPDAQMFSIDVLCDSIGEVMCKVEQGAQGAVEIHGLYTTPGEWQTITFDMSSSATGVLNNDYKQLVIFMGIDHASEAAADLNYHVWYYDNVKGPGFTAGGNVDVTFNITDLGGTASAMMLKLNDLSVDLTGTQGVNAVWTGTFEQVTGTTIVSPIDYEYTLYVGGDTVAGLTNVALGITAGSGTMTVARNYGEAPSGQNLLTEGDFSGGDRVLVGRTANEWGMWTQNGGVAEIIDGVCTVTPVQDLTNNWSMQVEQWNFALENQWDYTATFTAWSDADRVICLTIEDPANSYAPFGASDDEGAYDGRSKWDINITTDPTEYVLTFICDGMKSNSTPKFAFLLAQTSDKVYIDDVSLVKGEYWNVNEGKASSLKLYPNPATDNVYVNSKVGSAIEVYNITGQLVMSKVATTTLENINVSGLTSGLYIVKVEDHAERLIVK